MIWVGSLIDYGDDGPMRASVHSNSNSSALDCPN